MLGAAGHRPGERSDIRGLLNSSDSAYRFDARFEARSDSKGRQPIVSAQRFVEWESERAKAVAGSNPPA